MKAPKAPRHLSAEARRWFDETTNDYSLEPQHLKLLQAAAEAWDSCQKARKIVAKEGQIVHDRYDKPKSHPAVAIERDSRLAFARLVRELDLEGEPGPDPRLPRR
ncbi:MAG: hypothetical protein M3P01_04145 [Actinomycetota bacterium]|nr:hypothetical protein [Actinomycetota bacterium]